MAPSWKEWNRSDVVYGIVLPLVVVLAIVLLSQVSSYMMSYGGISGSSGFVIGIISETEEVVITAAVPLFLGLIWNRWAGGASGFLMGAAWSIWYAVKDGLYTGSFQSGGRINLGPTLLGWALSAMLIGYMAGALNRGSQDFRRMLIVGMATTAIGGFFLLGMFQLSPSNVISFGFVAFEENVATRIAAGAIIAVIAFKVSKVSSSSSFVVNEQMWPPVPGEYLVVCRDSSCSVAVSTLASVKLAEEIAKIKPKGLRIVGKTETENIGIDKIIKNTVTNPAICFLIVAGKDPQGHQSGKTLLALWENGVDENMHVIGSPAIDPVLKNVTLQEIEAFRKQVKVIDLIGCEDPSKIANKIIELSSTKQPCSRKEGAVTTKPIATLTAPVIYAGKSSRSELDKAGYFVIIPQHPDKISVEHYSNDNTLLRVVEGKDAPSLYSKIIEGGWVTQLSHAAYLGKELARAELSLKMGVRYVQDQAQ